MTMKNNKDTILQLESAIKVVTAAINITNSMLLKKDWKHKRNEMTKQDVVACLELQILKLKESEENN